MKNQIPNCPGCGKKLSVYYAKACRKCRWDEAARAQVADRTRGRVAWNRGLSKSNGDVLAYGRPRSQETRERMSLAARKGSDSNFWKGGITEKNYKERQLVMNSSVYKRWRSAVFERDNYTCVECGDDEGGNLHADHIKPFSKYPELRFSLNNGRTLCIGCHQKTETYGGRAVNYA